MTTVSVRDVRLHLPKVLKGRKPCLVLRRGKPVAAIVPLTGDAETEEFLLSGSPRYRRLLEDLHDLRVIAERRKEPSVPLSRLERRLKKRDVSG
jgi:antitoxin (DNA-binding transcriptional repressor) of toxin-antitoxin stability system